MAKTATLNLPTIVRGTDWRHDFELFDEDGNGNLIRQNWLDYALDCQFKSEQGTDKAITVTPTLSVVGTDVMQISLTELQTLELPVGVLFYNLLITKADTTEQLIKGTITVDAGITTP